MTGSTRTTEASAAEGRAREVEEQLTDDERFGLVIALMGQSADFGTDRDPRIPEGTRMSAGYTPGVPRLGVPALQMSDASMGVTNPGYIGRDGDTATAMPALIFSASKPGGRAGSEKSTVSGFWPTNNIRVKCFLHPFGFGHAADSVH